MKKLFAMLLVVALAFSAIFVLAACDNNKTEVEKAIEAAQNMTLAELEAAAKKELEENPGLTFNADSLTSGVKGALLGVYDTDGVTLKKPGFVQKYEWAKDRVAYNSKKGATYQPVLNAAVDAWSAGNNQYVADFVMVQDASFVDSLVRQGFLLSYVPTGDDFDIAETDQNPLVGVTFNKVFMYNKIGKDADYLKNVWQLTGKDGATLKGRTSVTFQDPTAEDINMSFLVMLTSPDACAKLESAYQSYFGTAYDGSKDDYENIGYKFVYEFWKNAGSHSSDTTQAKALATSEYKNADKISFIGVAKFKDYISNTEGGGDTSNENYYANAIGAAGWNVEVEGLSGFTYNMWTLIPATARLPYTACLFIRYLLSENGYDAGFGGNLGYYSSNNLVDVAAGDKTLAQWKTVTIGENFEFLRANRFSVRQFVTGIK
ncbi:MAG: hypothetical protein NC132_03685 [Corallococcus sp.]|nr:hypothetical protein [Corallococcus sp.]MCM1359603.1 hypothetical protein [Corallococcus sp.]MCM1395195.1 hypothetical protein [Corallococcus sp.]